MAVGHVARFGHRRCNLQSITQQMHAGHVFGLVSNPVDFAPAFVRRNEVICNCTGLHWRQYIQHIRFYIAEFELGDIVGDINIHQLRTTAIFDHTGIHLGPGFLEQTRFGGDIHICVEDEHL